jgi:6-phosphogluconolactonase
MSAPQVVVHSTPEMLHAASAARLVTNLVDVQSARGSAKLVLTGGATGIAVLEELCRSPVRDAVDWSAVDIYWGDERFLPDGHADRNETQARAALLDHVDVDENRVHPMPPAKGRFGDDPEAAAEDYSRTLARAARPEDHGDVPTFDVLLLGMGPEGHVASVFPESPAVYETERAVIPVRNCPKPPPTRVSLTLPAIRRAAEVWLMVAGGDKAPSVAMALGGAGQTALPAAGAWGRRRTLWLLDSGAARKVPGLHTPPSG